MSAAQTRATPVVFPRDFLIESATTASHRPMVTASGAAFDAVEVDGRAHHEAPEVHLVERHVVNGGGRWVADHPRDQSVTRAGT